MLEKPSFLDSTSSANATGGTSSATKGEEDSLKAAKLLQNAVEEAQRDAAEAIKGMEKDEELMKRLTDIRKKSNCSFSALFIATSFSGTRVKRGQKDTRGVQSGLDQ